MPEPTLAIEDDGKVIIQQETPSWIAPSAWIEIDEEYAIPRSEWA